MSIEGEATKSSRYMTAQEVAAELQVSRAAVTDLVYAGELAALKASDKPNARLRISRASFERFCARREAEFADRIGGAA